MKVIKPPTPHDFSEEEYTIFLGGSIEMGAAIDWQTKVAVDLRHYNVTLLNPRRDDWDSTWKQDPTEGTKFYEQVQWEMVGQEFADLNVYFFDPTTKSPITLLEIGAYADADNSIICCPKEFWRYGNVAMFANRYGIQLVLSYEDLLNAIKERLNDEGDLLRH